MKKILGAGILFVLTTTIGGVLLIGAISPSKTRALPPLPPRPTPQPTPTPGSEPVPGGSPSSGGLITLYVQAGPRAIQEIGHWRNVWTVVQWRDGRRNWHDVDGWRGTLDTFNDDQGRKTWWVAREDLGAGPFRWAVYHGRGGNLLAYSKPFYLPGRPDQIVMVDASLAP